MTVAFAFFANDLVPVVLGPGWDDAVPICQLLAPAILVCAVINPSGWLLVSLGMVGRSLRIALVIAPLVIGGCVIGLPYGPQGVAIGYSAAMMLWVVPHFLWCVRGTVVSFTDLALVVSRPLIAGIVGASGAFVLLWVVGSSWPAVPRLLLGCTVFGGVYLWVILFVMGQKAFYLDTVRSITRRRAEEVLARP
jgi:PST family polysaccharide transporter